MERSDYNSVNNVAYNDLKYPANTHNDKDPGVELQPLSALAVDGGSLGNAVLSQSCGLGAHFLLENRDKSNGAEEHCKVHQNQYCNWSIKIDKDLQISIEPTTCLSKSWFQQPSV